MPHAAPRACLLATLVALLCTACGGDDAEHGLGTPTSTSSGGSGEAVAIRYERADGQRWQGRFTIEAGQESQINDPDAPDAAPPRLDLRLTAEVHSHHEATTDGRGRTRLTMRYENVSSPGVDPAMFEGEARGTVSHDAKGRPDAETLRLEGSLAKEARRLLASLQLAGFGGGPLWIPERPVREGESWSVQELTRPEAFRLLLEQASQPGVSFPTPTIQGRITVKRILREQGRVLLELALDALIEMKGPVRSSGGRGTMALGERIQGIATIDAATGLPLQIDVMRRRENTVKQSDGTISGQESSRLRIHGAVKALTPKENE